MGARSVTGLGRGGCPAPAVVDDDVRIRLNTKLCHGCVVMRSEERRQDQAVEVDYDRALLVD